MGNRSERLVGVLDGGASGVSGDKYLGALLALGAETRTLTRVSRTVAEIFPGVKKIDVSVEDVERGEVGAKLVKLDVQEDASGRNGKQLKSSTAKASEKLGLSQWGNGFVRDTLNTLLDAESNVHGHSPEDTVLQELGSADTLVDIIGTGFLIQQLELERVAWISTPLAVGGGFTRFSGREYPNPPPAVIEILKASTFPFWGGHEKTELTTPTGAAITVNLAKSASESYPNMTPSMIGYGAGSKELDETANILRIAVGAQNVDAHLHDNMIILETNLDDVTGEVLGFTMEKLMSEGARDVTITPVYMKKNRPGHILSVVADEKDAEKLARIMIEETGTLGVREIPVRRHISLRRNSSREIALGRKSLKVRMKQAYDRTGKIIHEKPESDDLKVIASETGISMREASRLALDGRRKR